MTKHCLPCVYVCACACTGVCVCACMCVCVGGGGGGGGVRTLYISDWRGFKLGIT